jgi:threonine synthase
MIGSDSSQYLSCTSCDNKYEPHPSVWRCNCGNPLNLVPAPTLDPQKLASGSGSLWRYRRALPKVDDQNIVSLGEGITPLVDWVNSSPLKFKLDFLLPTGSFKDRGSTVLASCLKQFGVNRAIIDSSGNAGASFAAYCARAGIMCRVFVPFSISPQKLNQLAAYGAEVVKVEGSREDVGLMARASSSDGYYAGHLWSPYFLAGTVTVAYEMWEQLGFVAPANVVVPVGGGTLLLGIYLGFKSLLSEGLVSQIPKIFGVQAKACAPLYHAWLLGRESLRDLDATCEDTSAEGIRIRVPPRGTEILKALRDSDGQMVAVSEEHILQAWLTLARGGYLVEPTSAAGMAGARDLMERRVIGDREITVVPLTGTGLKSATFLSRL